MIATKKDLVAWLKTHDLMIEGSRNNDAVNLCILAVREYGVPADATELRDFIDKVVKKYDIKFDEATDWEDYGKRILRILPYLEAWDEEDILSYVCE